MSTNAEQVGQAERQDPERKTPSLRLPRQWRSRVGRWTRALGMLTFSSLTRRIVVLNLAGLAALVIGIFYLNQFREGLIEARVQALLAQGEIMASAVAASATVETGRINIDPERLLEAQADDDTSFDSNPLIFPLNPEKVAPLIRRLVSPTKLRARVYDRDGNIVIDSRILFIYSDTPNKPDLPATLEQQSWWRQMWTRLRQAFTGPSLPLYQELGSRNGKGYDEVVAALSGRPATRVRVNDKGESIVSVAVPIQRAKSILGILLLSSQPGEIDQIVTNERLAILRVFTVAALVTGILSILLAGTIAGPVRRLAEAAERVRHGVKSRHEIPDFTERSDEIGHLSGALRDMTNALFNRIEAIESFAADVAHELKNPLTSLRSAVETLPLAKTDTARARLLDVIQHDVRRLDRLISDISDASRLDAELMRAGAEPVDVAKLLQAVVSVFNSIERPDKVKVALTLPTGLAPSALFVNGHDSRLGQVVNNLVDNARSFSPPGGEVRVSLRRVRDTLEIRIDDDGPGVPDHARERIFERFYTDRPEEQGFGQNSGLGLSISRQIIEAHGGTLHVENRTDGETVKGACFIVRLPATS